MALASRVDSTALPPFSVHDQQLAVLLPWLRRLLAWQLAVTRQIYGALANDEYRGLYIPTAEADLLCADSPLLAPELLVQRHKLAAERESLRQGLAASVDATRSPLLHVWHTFGLTPLEQDILLLALAPELELRYERIFAYIQDDVSKRRPSVDLAIRLFCATPAERRRGRAAFSSRAPLMRHRLIQLYEDGQRQSPLLARFIKIDDRIVAELVGQGDAEGDWPDLDPLVESFVSYAQPIRSLESLVLPVELRERLQQALAARQSGVVLGLQGGYGSGRRAVAEALCSAAGLALLTVDLEQVVEGDGAVGAVLAPREIIRRVLREAALRGAAILWLGADRLLHGQDQVVWSKSLLAALDTHPGCSFLALDQPWEARGLLRRSRFLRVELPLLTYGERELLWRQQLNGASPGEGTLQALASTFRLSGGQIRDAAAMARSLTQWRVGPGQHQVSDHDLYTACRAQSSGRLDALAHKVRTSYTWDDIVLPPGQISQLREISIQVRHRRTVLEGWGFDKHLAMGKGVNALFAGQSGTGKTMAAEIIAADLGLELYKIDLSTMVSKYIGETEKNLDKVFTAAHEANAILFFDEADALFGKRSEVKDAHDRYANIEVGYLLQKMEEYDGVVILATNLRKNLDDAFVRRLHVAIDFPFPEEPDRLRIWRKVFPPEAPLADDVSLPFVAKQFKLAGGNIRNIALLAAYLAAEENSTIGMSQIVRAIRREYQKIGKLVTAGEFGTWLHVLHDRR